MNFKDSTFRLVNPETKGLMFYDFSLISVFATTIYYDFFEDGVELWLLKEEISPLLKFIWKIIIYYNLYLLVYEQCIFSRHL